MEELVSKSVPENIRLNRELKLDEPLCECVGVVCVCGGGECVYVCGRSVCMCVCKGGDMCCVCGDGVSVVSVVCVCRERV